MMTREPDFVDECYSDKDLSLLNKLTLVIPTYNRNYYLSRCLWYHAHFHFGEIIVADSSPEEKKVVNRETVAKVREMFGANVRYLEYEPETEKYGGDIYRKWGDAVQHVETEYSQICTDKEFLIPNTLCHNIQFLDEHAEYISSSGLRYFIKKIHLSKSEEIYYLTPKVSSQCSETSENPIDRFLDSLTVQKPYDNNLLLNLFRTSILKRLYTLMVSYEINDIRYGEIHLGYSGYLLGKSNVLDSAIHKVRDVINLELEISNSVVKGNNLNYKESSSSRYLSFDDFVMFYTQYKSCIADLMSEASNITHIKAMDIIDKYINTKLFYKYNHKDENVKIVPTSLFGFWDKHPKFRMIVMNTKFNPYFLKIIKILNKYGFNIPTNNGDILFSKSFVPELKIIENVLIITSKYNTNDETIV